MSSVDEEGEHSSDYNPATRGYEELPPVELHSTPQPALLPKSGSQRKVSCERLRPVAASRQGIEDDPPQRSEFAQAELRDQGIR